MRGSGASVTAGLHAVRGFSLVELLVSLALGLLLTTAMASLYLTSKRHYLLDEEQARLQEHGRFALQLLRRELTHAGFFAANPGLRGMRPPALAPDCGSAPDWALSPGMPLDLVGDFSGSAVSVTGAHLDCLPVADIVRGTDVVGVKRTAGEATVRNGRLTPGVASADRDQWYLRVANYGADIDWRFIGAAGVPAADLDGSAPVDYWEVYANLFFVRRYSDRGDGIPTLCTERLSGNSMGPVECLVEGVEDLQLEFGIDSDGDGVPNRYLASPTSAELASAVAARIFLLVRSLHPVQGFSDNRVYHLGQKTLAAKRDGYARRLFSTTVSIRNVP